MKTLVQTRSPSGFTGQLWRICGAMGQRVNETWMTRPSDCGLGLLLPSPWRGGGPREPLCFYAAWGAFSPALCPFCPLVLKIQGAKSIPSGPEDGRTMQTGLSTHSPHLKSSSPTSCPAPTFSLTIPFHPLLSSCQNRPVTTSDHARLLQASRMWPSHPRPM